MKNLIFEDKIFICIQNECSSLVTNLPEDNSNYFWCKMKPKEKIAK